MKNRNVEQYNAVIIGAGNIAASYDKPGDTSILTHAHAIVAHDSINLLGFIDIDYRKAQLAASIWNTQAFASIAEVTGKHAVDIFCVAVPSDRHYSVLLELLDLPIKLIFIEKPFTNNLKEAKSIIELSKGKITIAVNYSRRYVPEIEKIIERIQNGEYGNLLSGIAYYGKGIINNGSHLIDFISQAFGEIKDKIILDTINDYCFEDPTITAILFLQNKGKFFLQGVSRNKYEIFEIDMLFDNKRIQIMDLGQKIIEHDVAISTVYKGYRNLSEASERETTLSMSLFNAYNNIYKYLEGTESLKCSADDAYKTLEACFVIKGD